jgi:hypothetical protein
MKQYKKVAKKALDFMLYKRFTPSLLYKNGYYAENVNAEYFKKNERFYKVYLDEKYGCKLYKVKFSTLLLTKTENILRLLIISPVILLIIPPTLIEVFGEKRKEKRESKNRYKRIK